MRASARNGTRLTLAVCIALACGAAVADPGCSNATLSGSYVFTASGFGAPAGTWVPKAILEYIQFNGDGTLVVPAATVANRAGDGQVVASPPNGTGQYNVDQTCTGTLTFHNGPAFNLVAEPKGDTLWMIQTNPNNVFQGTVTRISK